ncbi:MAG: tetratricopeptide repeat protein [Chitinophagales bacterium]
MQKIMQINWIILLALLLLGLNTDDCFAQKKKGKKKKKGKVEQVETKVAPEENVDTSESDALLAEDATLWGADSAETVKNYSLYREFFKQKAYDDALPYWKYVLENAPAARKTPYLDGEDMYTSMLEAQYTTVCKDGTELEGWKKTSNCKENGGFQEYKVADQAKADAYLDTIDQLYSKRIEHFGEEGYIYALRSRLIKNYKPQEVDTIYKLREKSIAIDAESSMYDIVYYQYKDVVGKFKKKEIDADRFTELYDELYSIMEHNGENHEKEKIAAQYIKYGEKMESWRERYEEAMDTKRANAATDCPTVKEVWGAKYRENPNDMKMVKTVYSKLKRGRCTSDPLFMELMLKMYELDPKGSLARYIAVQYQKKKDYETAMSWYKKSLNTETDITKNAGTYLKLAKMEQIKGNYSQARTYARDAAKMRAGWGAPYILIGNLYASSGKKVSDGLGGRSVYWAAVDMYAKAKEIDPAVASDAQKKINKYAGAFPSKEDVFLKLNKSPGASFVVGGWIQQRTRIR